MYAFIISLLIDYGTFCPYSIFMLFYMHDKTLVSYHITAVSQPRRPQHELKFSCIHFHVYATCRLPVSNKTFCVPTSP